jgi:tetratricopeptide (TPR) repeat protein
MSKASLLIGALTLLLALGVTPALAKKQKPTPKTSSSTITESDVRVCIGSDGSAPDEQIPACTKIINSGKIHSPHEGDYYATRGAAYVAIKQFDAALADYDKALTYQKKGEFYFQRSLVLMAKNRPDKAKADLAQVIVLNPEFAPAYFTRGLINYQGSDFKGALADFDAATQRKPLYYKAIFARGAAKMKLGDDSGGKEDLKQARGLSAHIDDEMKTMGVVP